MNDMTSMTPRQIYGLAVRAGIGVAVKRNKVDEWWEQHPEFAAVREKVLEGSAQDLAEVIEMAKKIPNCVGIFNENGDGTATFYPTDSSG